MRSHAFDFAVCSFSLQNLLLFVVRLGYLPTPSVVLSLRTVVLTLRTVVPGEVVFEVFIRGNSSEAIDIAGLRLSAICLHCEIKYQKTNKCIL